MSFQRTISVRGSKLIQNVEIHFTFDYESSVTPTSVYFNYQHGEVYVSGNAIENKINNYNVSGGIANSDLLELVQQECTSVLRNYETV